MQQLTCPKCDSKNYEIKMRDNHRVAYCKNCGAYIKNIPVPISEFIWPVGKKFKGKMLRTIPDWYMDWVIENFEDDNLKKKMIEWKKEKEKIQLKIWNEKITK